MKFSLAALISILLAFSPVARANPMNARFSVVAGTAVRISTQHVRVHSILIMMRTGGTGRGYILRVVPGTALDSTSAAQVSAELAPATATAPGGYYADNDLAPLGARKEIWLDWFGLDVSANSDILVTYDPYQ